MDGPNYALVTGEIKNLYVCGAHNDKYRTRHWAEPHPSDSSIWAVCSLNALILRYKTGCLAACLPSICCAASLHDQIHPPLSCPFFHHTLYMRSLKIPATPDHYPARSRRWQPRDPRGRPSTQPRRFLPHLFLHPGPTSAGLATPPGSWTHVLRVATATSEHPSGTFAVAQSAHSTHFLTLYVAASDIADPGRDTARLILGPRQLMAARDFLALALPHGPELGAPDDVHVLPAGLEAPRVVLVGPQRTLLVIALVYRAFAACSSVKTVIEAAMEDEEDIEDRELLGGDAMMGLSAREIQVLEYFAAGGDDMM
ncbi:hypothetical protein MIND_00565200 [Mycena indigotica]|uniref:Uncharacterized protein n=1 Tax=Mycena indigotica TaxID=2126181 RepID=A0A8H6SPC6_9AGAR|nr:uncharacterized protein MIND_00565200 [Mycena indigotica]KAF7303373.1 hypothetical protein MIND_00565200 [Mycena indigotica]